MSNPEAPEQSERKCKSRLRLRVCTFRWFGRQQRAWKVISPGWKLFCSIKDHPFRVRVLMMAVSLANWFQYVSNRNFVGWTSPLQESYIKRWCSKFAPTLSPSPCFDSILVNIIFPLLAKLGRPCSNTGLPLRRRQQSQPGRTTPPWSGR